MKSIRGKNKILMILWVAILVNLFLELWAGPLRAMAPVERVVLPNKLILLISEDHSLPFVTLGLLVDAGSRQDPSGKEGLAHLTAQGLLWGTQKNPARAINEELDFMGAALNSSAGRDYASLSLRVLKKDFDRGLRLFLETLTQPAYPKEEIEREVGKTLAQIQSAEDDPGFVAEREFRQDLFGKGPYGHPIIGTRESLRQVKRQDLWEFYRQYYHPSNSILAVVGDVSREELKTELFPVLERWPGAKTSQTPYLSQWAKGPKTMKIERAVTQASIVLGHGGVSRKNPDFYAITVMNYILGGGGFSSRLVEEIRNKRGLAYSVASFFEADQYPGSFQIVLQTKNASAREAISLALQQMERMQKEMVSEKELEGAKKYFIGSFPMRIDTQAKRIQFLTQVEYYGLGQDYPQKYRGLIQAVTREEVQRVAQTYLHPKDCLQVIVANLKEAGME
jgi:zinc protease